MEYLLYNQTGIIGMRGSIPKDDENLQFVELNPTNQAIYENCKNPKIVDGAIVEGEIVPAEPVILDEISASRFFENVFVKTGLDEDAIIIRILAIPTQFLTDNEKVIVIIKLRKSTSFVRTDATLVQMATILKINLEQIFTDEKATD